MEKSPMFDGGVLLKIIKALNKKISMKLYRLLKEHGDKYEYYKNLCAAYRLW